MTLWAGIDEAGYGPRLGPLVVAATAFRVARRVHEGLLWDVLQDALLRAKAGAGDRLIIDDSKRVYRRRGDLKRLEEGVLSFCALVHALPQSAEALFAALSADRDAGGDLPPWFAGIRRLDLPLASNLSAVRSKRDMLAAAAEQADILPHGFHTCVVLPEEFNKTVSRTGNKSFLLFQKCGVLLQKLWKKAGPGSAFVLVDKHGGRMRYRKLLCDAFPHCSCDILREAPEASVYRLQADSRVLTVAFKRKADELALPTALASMFAKYVREVYMYAFNRYWQERRPGLKAATGYGGDAAGFLAGIKPLLDADGVAPDELVRLK